MSRHGSDDPSPGGNVDHIPVGVPLVLVAKEVKRGRNTYEGQDEPQYEIVWATPDDTWVYDWISPTHVRDQQSGTPSKAKQLAASLTGRIPLQVANVWWDDESFEFGFDAAKLEVAGRLLVGARVMAELARKTDRAGNARLRVSRYLPIAQAAHTAPPAAATPPQLSPDGRWWWDGSAWQPIAQRAPQPVPGELI